MVTEEGNTRPEVLDRISVILIVKGPSYKVVYLEKLCKHSCMGKCFKCMQSTFAFENAFENICFDYVSYSQADTYSEYSITCMQEAPTAYGL